VDILCWSDTLRTRLRLRMITLMMAVMTATCSSSYIVEAQRWTGVLPAGGLFRTRATPYNIPIAEPEPEPLILRLSSQHSQTNMHYPYRIPFAQPEPEPVARRLFRRLVTSQNQNKVTNQNRNQNQNKNKMLNPVKSTKSKPTTTSGKSKVTDPRKIVSTKRTIILNQQDNIFSNSDDNKFATIILDRSSWPVDTAQFDIIPAVPSKKTTKGIERVPKNMSEDNIDDKDIVTQNYEPKQFSPVPAVPHATTASADKLAKAPEDSPKMSEEDSGENRMLSDQDESCIEKCSQQFCVEDSLSLSSCVDKCSSLCSGI